MRGWVAITGTLLILVALVPTSGLARSASVPSKLVGQWRREVSLADLKRANTGVIPPVIPVGTTCTLTIKTSGAFDLACTKGVGKYHGLLVPAGPSRFYVKVDVPERNVYRWKVTGRTLTFTKVVEPVSDRAAVLWGVWPRT